MPRADLNGESNLSEAEEAFIGVRSEEGLGQAVRRPA